VQVADGPLMRMDVLEWSRHFRCFPGQGALDVAGVVAAALEAGYRGPVSLEVFSDVVREADPFVTARDGFRSLVFLEDQLASRLSEPAAATVSAPPPAPDRTDWAFIELANPDGSPEPAALLESLGFVRAGGHRSKPVSVWRNGGAYVVLNDSPGGSRWHALGLATPQVETVAARAKALLWPAVDRRRDAGESLLPGITSPSGVHVFVSATAGERDDWRGDFVSSSGATGDGWSGLDHVGIAVPSDRLNEEVGFLRTVFDLQPAPVEEFWEPHGRLLSRALRPARGDTRLVLNVEDVRARVPRAGITQVAFSCTGLLAKVRLLRDRGVSLMAVPDNYYVDLAARFDLSEEFIAELREHGVLYDRIGDGELLHVYTDVLATGFYVELLERRGGYDGYGSANTHVRLASQLP
jgi:4-hydroxyphenylpyruvate dioxygenase